MGIDIYHWEAGVSLRLRIGGTMHAVGRITRLWKVTETGDRPGRVDAIETLADLQAARTADTPPVVIIDALHTFGERDEIPAYQILGWDRGRLKTQDFDWDHLPALGWAVADADGMWVAHEEVDGGLVPMSESRAVVLGILTADGGLAEHRLPTISECRSVKRVFGSTYVGDCVFREGGDGQVFGESESGELPDTGWLLGRDTGQAARYSLLDQLAWKGGSAR